MSAFLLALVLHAGPPAEGRAPVPPPRVTPQVRRALGVDRGALVPLADGSYVYRDRKAGFAATIHRDGRVTFRTLLPIELESPADWVAAHEEIYRVAVGA